MEEELCWFEDDMPTLFLESPMVIGGGGIILADILWLLIDEDLSRFVDGPPIVGGVGGATPIDAGGVILAVSLLP